MFVSKTSLTSQPLRCALVSETDIQRDGDQFFIQLTIIEC